MKKSILVACIALVLACMLPVLCFAEGQKDTVSSGAWDYSKNDDGTVTISAWHGEDEALAIPAEIDGLKVTGIGKEAFFSSYKLKSITIPDSVANIGEGAFSACNSLSSISVSEGNERYTVVDNVLFEKDGKTLIAYPGGIAGGDYAIPEGTVKIGGYAFAHCASLTGVTIPKSLKEIGEGAFYSCKDFKNITIPDTVTEVGESAFYACVDLTSIEIPKSVTEIEEHLFENCSALTSVTIPDSVTEIGDYAFEFCENLKDISLPDKLTKIGKRAFCACNSLTSVTIPDSVKEIGEWAFGTCDSLTSIEVSPNNSAYTVMDHALVEKKSMMLVVYPAGLTDSMYAVPEGIVKIGRSAFSDNNTLTSVTIPGTVTEIGEHGFSLCHNLTSVTVPASVTTIGAHAFVSCKNLTLTVEADSYAEQYAKDNQVPYTYPTA